MDFPPHLGSMPMHAITEVYGEAGLRDRFRLEIQPFPTAARTRLTDALDLAAELHRDDRRVREPYLNHLLRVAIRIMHHYRVRDVDVIVAGAAARRRRGPPGRAGRVTAMPGHRPAHRGRAGRAGRAVQPTGGRLVAAVTNPVYDPEPGPQRAVPGASGGRAWTGSRGRG